MVSLNNESLRHIPHDISRHNNSPSPKDYYSSNFQSFTSTEINQRNFPSKANYFGQTGPRPNNTTEKNIGTQSPVLNYYASLSPSFSKVNQNYSPEQNYNGDNSKHSPFMGGNMNGEQTFNFSPSNIFNIGNQKSNNSYNIFNLGNHHQNGDMQNNNTNKSLAEKMQHLVGKTDDNNLISKNQNNEQKSEEEDDNDNDEMYFLSLNICDDKENEEEINNFAHNNNNNNNNNDNLNQAHNNIKDLNNININNTSLQSNNNSNNFTQKPLENRENNDIIDNNHLNNINNINNNINNTENQAFLLKNKTENNNEEKNKKSGMVEKIINSGELPKPYIPNKYRINIMEINQINNFQDDNMLPSYGGSMNNNNNLVNNFTINNNINNNFSINNNIINNNLIGNPNFNIGGGHNLNNKMNNNQNNNIMVNNNPLQMIKEKEISPYPTKIGEFLNIQNRPNLINPNENNKFEINNMNNFPQSQSLNYFNNNNFNKNNNYINNFYYNGDNYQISQFKQYKKSDNSNNGQIRSICADDFVTTITANNKKIKRIDPNTYLNESLEYLSFNILPLAKDQAGCRFLQEKLDKEPIKATNLFFNAILPHLLTIIKDPFGNYLIQKLCNNLKPDQIIKILEKISPTILDIGSNNHGTRVIQHIINFLSTKQLLDYFLKSIEPYVIPLLKELNGTHIIQQLLIKHPDSANIINKIISENCASLATHSHGCCVLQKFLNGKDRNLKENLISNLINNCLVLIIDQYGNYVIQSILLLNENKSSTEIAMKIYDNVAYYSKHRYSSNVVEKCFDFCDKNVRKKLAEKLSPPDILADLIIDEHGNYVIQKALACSENKEQEIILNNIIPLVPKIKNVSFGEKLLSRLMATYPQFKYKIIEGNININSSGNNNNNNNNFNNSGNMNFINYSNINQNNNNGYNNNYKKGNKKKKGVKNNNNNNMGYNNNYYNNSNNNMNNNNLYFNKNENVNDDNRSNNRNEGNNQYKNRGNKKNYKNRRDYRDDQKNRKNYYNSNDKSNNNENNQ